MSSGLMRYNPSEGMQSMGALFVASKDTRRLHCLLSSHPLGWEVRLQLAGELLRSQVCKHDADVFKTAETWKAEAEGKGWR